jgi:hypothetical protein
MNRLCVIAVLGVFGAVLNASERAVVTMRCPLDDTEFQTVQEFSGFAAGQRLDLKKLGAISQPRPLARCPECSLPIWDKYLDEDHKVRLRAALQSDRYRAEGRPASPWFALGVLREELAADAYTVAWTYLQASWEAEESDQPDVYAVAARRALTWFDRAATALARNEERRDEYRLALYLPIELARRTEDFADARRRLDAWPGDSDPWLHAAIESQRRLIAAGQSAADDRLPEPVSRTVSP